MSYRTNEDYFRYQTGSSMLSSYCGQFVNSSSTSEVIKKLSSTRKKLEQTLNKNHRLAVKVDKVQIPDSNLHHELSSPTFSHITQIYESYTKAPVNSKVQIKSPIVKRTASAPMIYLKTKEKMIQESEELIKKECTFRPKINKSPTKQNSESEQMMVSKEEWLSKMSKSKAEVLEQREKLKREQEDNLNKSSGLRSTAHSSSTNGAVDRLYTTERKGLKMEQIKRERDEKEAILFNFSPQLSKNSIALIKKKQEAPLYTRIKEVQEELKLKKTQLQTRTQNFTFKPLISDKSSRLAGYKCNGSIVERLSKDSSIAKSISEKSSVPEIKQTRSIIDHKEFMNRQIEHLSKSQKVRQQLVNKSAQELKFQPEINENSNFIANYKYNFSAESQEEKIERITKGALAKKAKIQEGLEKKVYSNLKFEPQINPISQKLAKSTKFLNSSKELKLSKKLKAQSSVAELEKVCSFSPVLKNPKKFEGLHSRYNQSMNIMEEIEKQRELKLKYEEEIKDSINAKVLNECTFKPKKFERIENEGNIRVKGAERFFELRNIALSQKYEKEMREKKVLYKDQAR